MASEFRLLFINLNLTIVIEPRLYAPRKHHQYHPIFFLLLCIKTAKNLLVEVNSHTI